MTSEGRRPQLALVLLNNSGIGGTERRFAQVYTALRRRQEAVVLVINESLWDGLVRGGILEAEGKPALVVKEPMGRLAGLLFGRRRTSTRAGARLAFALGKLDYVLACAVVGWWLVRQRPAVMHLVLGGAYIALPLQMTGMAPPAVVSVVNPNLRGMVGSSVGLFLYRLALWKARLVDALTESIGQALIREGIPHERLRVSTGSSVDPIRFHPASSKQPWVVFSGRLIPEKNPALFVEACALVHKRVPGARFLLLGQGPLWDQVVAQVRRAGLESCFLKMGWCDHVEALLAEALVFVSLQRTDNYPSQALLEAMASEAAVVATDEGLTWKLVAEGVGLRVEARQQAVADAVVYLLDHPEQAAAMGKRGRDLVVREHSMDRYLDYLHGLYATARGGGVDRESWAVSSE